MDIKAFIKTYWLYIVVILISFFVIFFVNYPALVNPCNWQRVCPDFIRQSIVSVYPNFYMPAGCGYGIAYVCWESSLSFSTLILDASFWFSVNVVFFALTYRQKK